jgi:ribosomal protein S18 acetylase RimI-like enzyme
VTVGTRLATPHDAEAIARIHTDAWQRAYRGLMPDEYLDGLRPDARVRMWTDILQTPGTANLVLVAVDASDRVVGFVSLGLTRDDDLRDQHWHEVYALYVHPDRWRQGVGMRLLEAGLGTIPAGPPGVTLWVLRENERARSFYERAGFWADGATRVEDIGGLALDEFRYRRPRLP